MHILQAIHDVKKKNTTNQNRLLFAIGLWPDFEASRLIVDTLISCGQLISILTGLRLCNLHNKLQCTVYSDTFLIVISFFSNLSYSSSAVHTGQRFLPVCILNFGWPLIDADLCRHGIVFSRFISGDIASLSITHHILSNTLKKAYQSCDLHQLWRENVDLLPHVLHSQIVAVMKMFQYFLLF